MIEFNKNLNPKHVYNNDLRKTHTTPYDKDTISIDSESKKLFSHIYRLQLQSVLSLFSLICRS